MKLFFARLQPSVATVEIGSSKISCWVSSRDNQGDIVVLGSSHASSRGIFGNKLLDMEKMEGALRRVLYEAEKSSGRQIRQVTLTLSSAFFTSERHAVSSRLPQKTMITPDHVQGLVKSLPIERYPVHMIPMEFSVDEQKGIENPCGMIGSHLGAFFHVIGMAEPTMSSLIACLKRCQIKTTALICSGYSSALACLTPDEQILGATLVDFGAAGTSCTSFFQNKLVDFRWFPLGGSHITQDIARGCDTSLLYAERLKILYGAAVASQADQQELIPLVLLGEHGTAASSQMTRAFLINVIRARAQEIMTCLKPQLVALRKHFPFAAQRLVFTGGGSQLLGLKELGQQTLSATVRLAKPAPIKNAPYETPGFSAITGALFYAYNRAS